MIATCWADGCETLVARPKSQVTLLVVHRIEVSQEDASFSDTPPDVARFFRDHPVGQRATGGAMPYPLLIDAAGQVTQTVPLGRVTPHVRAYNPQALGVGVLGDFRTRPPTPAQYEALVRVLVGLARELGLAASAVVAHDELSGGSADPDKECPGRALSLAVVREAVAQALGQTQAEPLAFVW